MKKTFLILCFVVAAKLQAQQLQWAHSFGVSGGDCVGSSAALDNSGNVYVTGSFDGTIDFDPGSGTHNLTSGAFGASVFLAKYDASGNYLWAFSIGNANGGGSGLSVVTDAQDNAIITGNLSGGPVDFDPGSGTQNLTSAGNQDAFLAKYDSGGNYLWAFDIGSFGNASQGNSIKCDAAGNIYLVGYFHGTVDFDPSSSTSDLNGGGAFMAKYSAAGNYTYAINFPGTASAQDLALDAAGTIFITGDFMGTIDFDPGAGTSNLTNANYFDLFLASYSAAGNYLWAFNTGCNASNGSEGCSVRTKNNSVYLAGSFSGTNDFDPGSGTHILTSNNGGIDMFLAKYTKAGALSWVKQIGAATSTFEKTVANHMDQDINGNLFVTGYFDGATDFDPGSQTNIHTANNSNYLFVARYDSSGNHGWAFDVGSNGQGDNKGLGICLDQASHIYCSGFFGGNNNDFDAGPGTYYLNDSSMSMYLAKYDIATVSIKTYTIDELKSFPNPVSDLIKFDLPAGENGFDFTIISGQGQNICSGHCTSEVDVSNLEPGIYFITLKNKESLYGEKFLIIR